MKKVIALIFTICISISIPILPTFAAEATVDFANASVQDTPQDITPRIVHSYEKEVQQTYYTYGIIPLSIFYEEYNMGTTFSGTLYLADAYELGGIWYATFTGSLVGRI